MALQKSVKCKNEIVHFDPLRLFSRLISIAKQTKKFKEYFKYELTQEPTSLFKDGFMRRSYSDLKNILIENVHNFETYPTSKIVVDGGALLHQVSWNKNCSYSEVIDQYCDYLQNNYGSCIVVFDGYGNGASTKDHEHRRRNKGMAFPYVKIELDMVAHNKQNDLLSNKLNKNQFISLLGNRLQTKGFIVHQSSNDADTIIVKCAIELVLAGNFCTVITVDADILVLLMYYFQPSMADIFLFPIASKRRKSGHKIVGFKNVIHAKDRFIKENINFAHAWSSCDTTWSTYGHGKSTILKYLKENKEVRQISQIFLDSSVSYLEILVAGI